MDKTIIIGYKKLSNQPLSENISINPFDNFGIDFFSNSPLVRRETDELDLFKFAKLGESYIVDQIHTVEHRVVEWLQHEAIEPDNIVLCYQKKESNEVSIKIVCTAFLV